jgi:hypothetical protein
MNRYYSSGSGRFVSVDPSTSSIKLKSPQSWNRYAYIAGDPVNGNDPSGLYVSDCDWSGSSFNATAAAAVLDGGGGNLASYTPCQGAVFSGQLAQISSAFEAGYDSYVAAVFAAAAANHNWTADPTCVQSAIDAAASGALGVDLASLNYATASVQIAGTDDGNGGTYGETELNLTGVNIALLISDLCAANFYSNGQCQNNNTWLVGSPHAAPTGPNIPAGTVFTGNFRSPGLTSSVQVNTAPNGVVQIDVDPYNPAAYPILGLLLHGGLQVLPNKIAGTDNTYGCVAN